MNPVVVRVIVLAVSMLCAPAHAATSTVPSPAAKPGMAAAKSVTPATKAEAAGAGSASEFRKRSVRVLIRAVHEAKLAAEDEGKIIDIPRKLGQSFRRGEVLVSFDCADRNAMLAGAEAGVLKAQKLLESKKTMQKMQAVADIDVGLAEADYQQALAQRDVSRTSVRKCHVIAPFDGRVARVLANQWESVGKGTPLIEIVDRSSLTLDALVPSAWLVWLKTGKRFSVHVDELGRDVAAEVTAVSGRVDAVSQTVQISARIVDNASGLLPGMSGSATFGN